MAKLGFKNINVLFGSFDSDLILEYTLTITVFKYEDATNEIFYDELRMVTSSKVEAKDDIVYFTILKNKLEIDNKFG